MHDLSFVEALAVRTISSHGFIEAGTSERSSDGVSGQRWAELGLCIDGEGFKLALECRAVKST